MIALVNTKTGNIVKLYFGMPDRVKLPGVGTVSPPVIGWADHGFAIVPIVPAAQVAGQVIKQRTYKFENDKVTEQAVYEPAKEAPPEKGAIDRVNEMLNPHQLTVGDLKSVLGG